MRTFEESFILKKVQKWTKGVLALYISSIFVAPLAIRPFVDENVQSYVTKELGGVMLAQEQKFGIHYSSLPTIKFEKRPSTSFLQSLFVAGVTQGNTVYLSPGLVETPEDNLKNSIISLLNFGISENVKGTLDHELGHIYQYELSSPSILVQHGALDFVMFFTKCTPLAVPNQVSLIHTYTIIN